MSLDNSRQSNSSVIIDIEDDSTYSCVNTHTGIIEQSLSGDGKEKQNKPLPDPKYKEIITSNDKAKNPSIDVTSQAQDKTKTQTFFASSQNTNSDMNKNGRSYRRHRKRRRVETNKGSKSSKSSSSEEGEIPPTLPDTSLQPPHPTTPAHPPPTYQQVAKDDDEETCVKSVFEGDERNVSMEDGQLNKSGEDDWDLSTVTDLLKAFHSLRKKVAKLEETKDQPCQMQLKDTVTKIVKEVLHEFKREMILDIKKETNLDSVQTDIKKCAQIMNSTKQKAVDIESRVNKLTEEGGDASVQQVSNIVFDRMNFMEDKVLDLEARQRRKNIVFHGVEVIPGESDMETAYRILEKYCDIDARDILIDRAHRIGREIPGSIKPPPFIIAFVHYQDKEGVKDCRHNLPDYVSMVDDFPRKIREDRKLLIPDMIAARNRGCHAYIRYPAQLVVDGEVVIPKGNVNDNDRINPYEPAAGAHRHHPRERAQGDDHSQHGNHSNQQDERWFTADRTGRHTENTYRGDTRYDNRRAGGQERRQAPYSNRSTGGHERRRAPGPHNNRYHGAPWDTRRAPSNNRGDGHHRLTHRRGLGANYYGPRR